MTDDRLHKFNMNGSMQPIHIIYNFQFEDKTEEVINIHLDRQTLMKELVKTEDKDWMRLEYRQCENCRLKKEESARCPIAVNLSDIIDRFDKRKSYEMALVRVTTEDRTYGKNVAVQQGLGSLIGIIMVTSGCPTMEILKPMVRFHMPFASVEETVFRSVSAYLLGQYFRNRRGKEPDLDLAGLLKGYQDIQKVNIGIIDRLRSTSDIDASTNAIVILDIFAKTFPASIIEGLLDIEYIFQAHLDMD